MICPCCEGKKICPACLGSGEINIREPMSAPPPGTPPAEFKRWVLGVIDDALGHSWMVRGDNRKLLQAIRTYVPNMPDDEINKLMEGMPY